MLKPVTLDRFVLQDGDIHELWPEATQEDLDGVAEVLQDYMMDQWYDCLVQAIETIKREDNV